MLRCYSWCVFLALGLVPQAFAASERTQSFLLQPGWNAIWIEVQPEPADADLIFRELPLSSAWVWMADAGPVDFVQDVSEPELERLGYRSWFPPDRPESVLTDYFKVVSHRAYLLNVEGTSPVNFTLTGRPTLETIRWAPESYNLVGFSVDPAASPGPTFSTLFAGSPAHAALEVHRLDPSGFWELVPNPAAANARAGEAFWVWTEGASDWQGPLDLLVSGVEDIDFGNALDQTRLEITNRGTSSRTVELQVAPDLSGLLARSYFDPATTDFTWPEVPATLPVTIAAGETHILDLGLRRADLSGPVKSLISFVDPLGLRFDIPVTVDTGPLVRGAGGSVPGLWLGTVTIDAVAEVHGADPTTPTPTASTLDYRVILHVDGSGQIRLLRDVLQMFEPGDEATSTPGQYVLVTLDDRIGDYVGADLRGDTTAPRRISAATYDFDERSPTFETASGALLVSGQMVPGQAVGPWTLVLPPDLPTHPYNHRFHPEHDLCGCATGDATCLADCSEAWTLSRQISMALDPEDPQADPGSGDPQPDWSTRRLSGTWTETLDGLHRDTLRFSGRVELQRVTDIAELNP